MGTLSRLAVALRDRLSKALPELSAAAEVDAALAELKAHLLSATKELVAYKAHDKQAAAELARLAEREGELGRHAEAAVRAGDDALARECLVEQKRVRETMAGLDRERALAGGHAAQLLAARRELSARLAQVELRKGTLAMQVAAARSPDGGPLAAQGPAWEALQRAEARIDDQAAAATLDAELGELDRDARLAAGLAQARADVALAELKQKAPAPLLPPGEKAKK